MRFQVAPLSMTNFENKIFFLSYFDSVYTVIVGVEVISALYLNQWHTKLGRTPPDEGSAHRRDFWQHTDSHQTSMSPVGFESTIPASKRPQTHALDRPATEIWLFLLLLLKKYVTYFMQAKNSPRSTCVSSIFTLVKTTNHYYLKNQANNTYS
jgi:hypothetical protein